MFSTPMGVPLELPTQLSNLLISTNTIHLDIWTYIIHIYVREYDPGSLYIYFQHVTSLLTQKTKYWGDL